MPMISSKAKYYPAIAYMYMLLLLLLLSWFVGLFDLMRGNGDTALHNLISVDGLRWFVGNAIENVGNAPWGMIFAALFTVGIFIKSGLWALLMSQLGEKRVPYKSKKAGMISFCFFCFFLFFLFAIVIWPWNIFMGAMGDIIGRGMYEGVLLLFFFSMVFFSLIYGFIYGTLKNLADVLMAMSSIVAFFIPSIVAIVIATQIICCAEFSGILALLDISNATLFLLHLFFYGFPFLYLLFFISNEQIKSEL